MESNTLETLHANAFVIIFASQFDNVIGLQFLISLISLPSLGSRVITDSRCEGGRVLLAILNFHEFRMIGPAILHNFL
jgi:hypothetical protein